MKLTLGLIFSVLVAVNSVTGAYPKNNDGPVYNPKGKPYQVIVEEGEFCDNYYLICNPTVKRKKYLACVYDGYLQGSYCKKVHVYYYDPPKKETIPIYPRPKNDEATKPTDHKPKNDEATIPIYPRPKNDEATKPIVPKPKNDEATKQTVLRPQNDGATKGSGNNANGMAALATMKNNPIGGSPPGADKANKKA